MAAAFVAECKPGPGRARGARGSDPDPGQSPGQADGDPVANIANIADIADIEKVDTVIKGGKVYDPAKIEQALGIIPRRAN